MQTRRFTLLSRMALAAVLTLLAGQGAVAGQDGGLAGTWNVTLRFPVCTAACSCPGGVPNIPIPALQTYLQHGSLLEVSGGSPLRGPGLGSWTHADDQGFAAHFKFFLFNPDGSRRGSEEVTTHIDLADPDAFEATAAFDLFDAAGNVISQGCGI